MKKLVFLLITAIAASSVAHAERVGTPTFHSDKDSARVMQIVEKLATDNLTHGRRIAQAAKMLKGATRDIYYSTDSVATLRVNLDELTPLMLVNTSIALARTSEKRGPGVDFNVFFKELENIACRKGNNEGFPSLMFHTSDWIGDNIARGNVTELTENYEGVVARTKSLDELTRKREDFAALSDSTTFEKVRMTEMGFRTHRIPSLKKETIKKKEIQGDLQDGDIIVFVANRDGIDWYDIGIIAFEDEIPHLIHLSPRQNTVIEESDDLSRYMTLITKYFQGYRIIRVTE